MGAFRTEMGAFKTSFDTEISILKSQIDGVNVNIINTGDKITNLTTFTQNHIALTNTIATTVTANINMPLSDIQVNLDFLEDIKNLLVIVADNTA